MASTSLSSPTHRLPASSAQSLRVCPCVYVNVSVCARAPAYHPHTHTEHDCVIDVSRGVVLDSSDSCHSSLALPFPLAHSAFLPALKLCAEECVYVCVCVCVCVMSSSKHEAKRRRRADLKDWGSRHLFPSLLPCRQPERHADSRQGPRAHAHTRTHTNLTH